MSDNDQKTNDEPVVSDAAESNTPTVQTVPKRSRFVAVKWLGKSLVHAAILTFVFVGGIALIGVAQRAGWIQAIEDVADVEPKSAAALKEANRYICPMMCTPPSNESGRCPVCAMELVEATSGGGDGLSVSIDPAARRLIGIQTAVSELGPVWQTIRTIGAIDYDESKQATISAYVGGRIEKLYANYVGVAVEKGDELASIYSPDLYSAQVEFLTAIQSKSLKRLGGGTSDFGKLAKQKLIELGLTEEQVAELRSRGKAESRIRVRSPIQGTVIEKNSVEGDYIETGDKIYRIADLSTVWVMLDLFPEHAARMRFGQQVETEVSSIPGEVFTGRVAFIDPTVNETKRTVSVRVEMLNPDGKLRPGDYATARVYVPAIRQSRIYDAALAGKFISPMHPQIIRDQSGDCPICGMDLIPTSKFGYTSKPLPKQQVVTVPRDAVLLTGENSVVYVETDPGRFEIRRVTVGPMTDDRAVILEGMSSGETVATHGNFLIDSQMQLAGNPSLMDPSKATIFPPGPVKLATIAPTMLVGESAKQFDRAFEAYFIVQQSLAADQTPLPVALNSLDDALGKLVELSEVPDSAQRHLQLAKRSLARTSGSIENSRAGFRLLSHALLRAATLVRGEKTADKLVHMFCPMVPGGGGDWMQADGELVNPYWGSEMLNCGETVRSMAVSVQLESEAR